VQHYTYVGPDGTDGTFFEDVDSGAIPFGTSGVSYTNPGECFRYKLYMTAIEPANSPIFRSIDVNYAP